MLLQRSTQRGPECRARFTFQELSELDRCEMQDLEGASLLGVYLHRFFEKIYPGYCILLHLEHLLKRVDLDVYVYVSDLSIVIDLPSTKCQR